MYGNPTGGNTAKASRGLDTALGAGDTFSIDIATAYRNGSKGIDLFVGGTKIWNFNVGGDQYQADGSDLGWSYSQTSIFNLKVTQNSGTSITINLTRGSDTFSTNLTVSSGFSGFDMYVSNTDQGNDLNNLFFNNLVATNSGVFSQGGTATNANSFTGSGNISVGSNTTLALSNTGNNFSGSVTVSNGSTLRAASLGTGTINLSGTLAAYDSTARTFTNSMILGNNVTFGDATGTGALTFSNVNLGTNIRTLTVANNTTISGQVSQGNLIKIGSGTLTLSGANDGTFTNATVGTGVLAVSGGSAISDSGAVILSNVSGATFLVSGNETIGSLQGGGGTGGHVSIAGSQTLTVAESGSQIFSGVISNAGGLTKTGNGTLTLSGNNSFTGGLTVANGTLSVGAATNLGGGAVTISSGGKLYTSAGFTAARAVTMGAGGGTIDVSTAGFTNTAGLNGSGALLKSGSGTLVLSETAGNYAGTATIGSGTLVANTTLGSAAVVVSNTGTLMGSGSLGAVTVQSGGIISPGNSPGTLAVSALTLDGGGSYRWEITTAPGAAGTDWDLISVGSGGGVITLNASSGNRFAIDVVGSSPTGFSSGTSYTWDIIDAGSWSTAFSADAFTINTNNFSAAGTLGTWSVQDSSGNLRLVYTAAVSDYNVTVNAGTENQGQASGGAAQFTGSVGVNKLGAGTLVMTNSLNDYTGVTIVKAGTVSITENAPTNGAGALGNNGNTVVIGDTAAAASASFEFGAAVTNNHGLSVVAGTGAAERVLGASIGSGTAHQSGNVALNTNAVFSVSSGGTLLVSGVVSGGGALTISNSGTTVLSGANTYTHTTTVLSGATLLAVNNAALGSTDAGTTVSSGGVLGLSNGITSAEAITLSGTGISSAGAIRSLSGNNTLSGNLTLAASSRVNADAALLTLSGGINGSGASHTLTVGGAGNTTISGAITNSTGGLTKDGAGTLTLSGNNSFSGVLTVAEGKLTVDTINNASANGVLGNSANAVVLGSSGQEGFLHYIGGTAGSDKAFTAASGGTAGLEVSNSATTLTLSGAIDGSGGVTKGGAGILYLTGGNTFSGPLNIHAGTLRIDGLGSLGSGASAVGLGKSGSGNTATFLYSGSTNASSSRAFDLVDSGGLGVISVSDSGAALTLSGAVSGSGRFEKSGVGSLVLVANNTYSGTTLVSAGTLSIGAGGTTGSLGSSTITNNATLLYNRSDNLTQSTVIHGSGALHKAGDGTLTLSQANQYTGATVVSNGAIRISSGTGLGTTAAGTTVNSGAALEVEGGISSAEALNIAGTGVGGNGALRSISGANTNTGTVTLSANATISADSGAGLRLANIDIGAANRQLTFSNAGTILMTGNFSNMDTGSTFFKEGAGSLVFSNTTANTGGGQLQLGGGTVTLAAGTFSTNSGTSVRALDLGLNSAGAASSQDTAFYVNSGLTMSNSVFVAAGTGLRTLGTESTSGTATFNREIFLGTGSTLRLSAAADANAAFTGNLVNSGDITKVGSGTVTLSGANTAVGTLTVGAGTLAITNGAAIADGNAVVFSNVAGAALHVNQSETIGSLAGGGSTGGNVSIAANQTLTVTETGVNTFSGSITNSGGLTKAGAGTLTLAGSNSFSGLLNISQGAISITNANSLGAGTVVVGSGNNLVTLLVNSNTTITNQLAIQDSAINSALTVATDQTVTVSGNLAQTNGTANGTKFGKDGAGTLVMNGANSTYNGQVQIGQGTVIVGTANALGTNVTTANRGIDLGLNVGDVSTANNVALLLSNGVNFGQSIYVAPNTSGARRTIGLANTDMAASFTNEIYLGGTLTADAASNANLTVSGNVINTGGLIKTGAGTLTLSGNNTFSGATTIAGGTLRISGNNRLGNTNTTLTISNGGVLDVTSAGTFTNSITIGTGNGVLSNSSGAALVVAGGVSKNGTVFTSRSGTGTNVFTGVISGASANSDFVVDGGTTVFSNAMTYNGPTIITNGGTLVLGTNNAIPTTSALTLGGGTLRAGNSETRYSQTLGTLTLTENSTIDLGSFTGGSTTQLTFADSSGVSWVSGKTLTITNWQGVALQSSTVAEIIFGSGGLTTTQLAQVYWAGQNIDGGALLGGELVPVPEPRVYAAAVALLAAVGWRERRRVLGASSRLFKRLRFHS
ncbi:MAG: hypothetical protein FGM15_05605 [Chthoniobacterales bacterium]|nr:hypothetical protein [Chthoniobacterales bacterium]